MSTADDVTKPPGPESSDAIAGFRVGPYRLVRELGRGGMGTVYLAVRSDDQFQKRVAIKILRRGMDSESIVRRFKHERQILASLQHPYIAALLDGGTTDEGLPYFAMEYVEGQLIPVFCDARNLNVSARLELFCKVCAAVQYAHQNLVIHRDIKPANVLVTPDGTPKLLDFGIAKLLNPELAGQTLAPTAAGMHLMTPEYASPEQVRGEVVTTTSDVYSLGVLLYELLTGRRPYRITSRSPAEAARVICHSVPVRPSTAVAQTPDQTTRTDAQTDGPDEAVPVGAVHQNPLPLHPTPARTERLRRRLSGDLDNIVLKALSKEPDRRYASAEQFAEDIRRHLRGLPVIARKDTVGYRAIKFVRRNRAAAAAALITFVALIAAVVVTTWQARVASAERRLAEQRFEDVRRLANAYLFEFHDAIRDLPGSTPPRKLLVSRGLEYLDKLAADAAGDTGLRIEVAQAYMRLGDVQGRPFNPNLGDTSGALASYKKAITLYESLQALQPANPAVRRELASAHLRLSALLTTMGDTAQSLVTAQKGLEVLRPLDAGDATPADIRRELVVAYSAVGDLLSMTGDTRGALEQRRTVVTTMEALSAVEPANVNNLRQLGVSYQKLANSLGNPNYPNVGDTSGALAFLQKSGDVFRTAISLYPANGIFKRNGAVVDSNTADVLTALKRPADAIVRQQQALAIFQELADADPADVAAANDVAISTFKVAQMLESSGRLLEAVSEYERSLSIHERLSAADPSNDDMKQELSSDASGLAGVQAKLGRKDESIRNHARGVALSRELHAKNPDNVELHVGVALALVERGATFVRFRDATAARRDYNEAVNILGGLEKKGVIEGTDLETLSAARAALAGIDRAGMYNSRMIPYHDENETQRPAYVTMLLIATCTLAWVFVQGAGVSVALATSVCDLGLIPGELTATVRAGVGFSMGHGLVCVTDAGRQYANVFTSMFMHGGWMHLIGNMWFLWLFGNNVEDSMTRPRFLVFYLLCGVAAALAQVAAQPDSIVPMVGASGAISGVMGAYLVLYPRVRVYTLLPLGFFFTTIALPAWAMLIYWMVLQIFGGLSQVGSEGGVAFWAHLGGFTAGLVLVRPFAKSNHILAHAAADYHPQWGRRQEW